MSASVVIVGGGLSGLCAAYRLHKNDIPFLLLEARDRLGGRILSTPTGAVDSVVQHVSQTPDGVIVRTLQSGVEHNMQARLLILALPPRVVSQSINFEPGLPSKNRQLLTQIPTWMADQAKFVAEYSEPFWQSLGLSGDGFSQLGPLGEIHDASPRVDGHHALFGFFSIPPSQRQGQEGALEQAAVQQLTRMFGDMASRPTAVHLKDWAFDERTATALDRDSAIPRGHGRPSLSSEWEDRLIWAGTETAGLTDHSNGYLEGAVEAGNRAADFVRKHLT